MAATVAAFGTWRTGTQSMRQDTCRTDAQPNGWPSATARPGSAESTHGRYKRPFDLALLTLACVPLWLAQALGGYDLAPRRKLRYDLLYIAGWGRGWISN